ncbi:Achaete-scute-like protein ASH3 [Operophtera brumata]|uniref:Achaete-scute-like protein ASH3 n=1 Tax=Operophtera brumata TaxID=104452 RepID=A0A0L7L1B7_OPEBR|nr:Achaete-scute-like protein ASH3 [Operophtera brumata]
MLQRVHQKSDYYSQRMVPIAPTPEKFSLDLQDNKYTYKSTGYNGAQVASIARRNARERNRVKQVNDGFNALRKKLPAAVIAAMAGGSRRGSGKKLSKVDTLKMVVEYIKYMENLIEDNDTSHGYSKTVTATHFEKDIDEGVYSGESPYSVSVPSPLPPARCDRYR